MTLLDRIVANKRREVERAKAGRPTDVDTLHDLPAPRDFAAALRGPGLSIIAEIKRRSPSMGALRRKLDAAELARTYERSGASAISCLTDARFFGARPEDLTAARAAVRLPVLRKDFIVDAYQLYESRQIGADAVLIVMRILPPAQLRNLLAVARELNLAALVEVHDERELDLALQAEAGIIGINNRDLGTFTVSLDTSLRLRPRIPPSCISVAESGIRSRADVERVAQAGFDAVLVGESLLRAADPGAALRALKGGAPQ